MLKTAWVKHSKTVMLFLTVGALVGCGSKGMPPSTSDASEKRDGEIETKFPRNIGEPNSYSSLAGASRLAKLAAMLDQEATFRSSVLQEKLAAEADWRATRYNRYPQFRPIGSIPLNESGKSSFGLGNPSIGAAIEQVVWDGGRNSAQLAIAELRVAEANLRAWQDRNNVVFEGLSALVQISQFQASLKAYEDFEERLGTISERLRVRAYGGVADRGELLRLDVAMQVLKRDIVTGKAGLQKARANLEQYLPANEDVVTSLPTLSDAEGACRRATSNSEAPADALAKLSVETARLEERLIKARSYPRVLLGASVSYYSDSGWSGPGLTINLDSNDLVFGNRREAKTSAAARTKAAIKTHELRIDVTEADFERFSREYSGLTEERKQLLLLIENGQETIELYEDQLNSGSIPIIEGITAHRERLDSKIAFINAQADSVRNCLEISRLLGHLAPYRAHYE